MSDSHTFKVMSRVGLYYKKKKSKAAKKKDLIKRHTRKKSNHWTYKQHGLYLELNKEFKDLDIAFIEDLKKGKIWWDFALAKYKTVIKIITFNNKPIDIEPLEKLGWRVLYINYDDPNKESFSQLLKDIKFIISKPKFIEKAAKRLNNNLPESEKWFLEKIKKEWFWKKIEFEQNVPMFGTYIYDLFSKKYRLCIEVDGSIHETSEQINRDHLKNETTISKGFHIIRVKAFNEESYNNCIKLINQVIKNSKARKYKLEVQQDINNKIIELNKNGKLGF